MTEDNPLPPPQEGPVAPSSARPLVSHPILRAAGGCLSSLVISGLIALAGIVFINDVPPLGILLIVGSIPSASVFLWLLARRSDPFFARGALAFGIVGFLVVGVCFIGVTGSIR